MDILDELCGDVGPEKCEVTDGDISTDVNLTKQCDTPASDVEENGDLSDTAFAWLGSDSTNGPHFLDSGNAYTGIGYEESNEKIDKGEPCPSTPSLDCIDQNICDDLEEADISAAFGLSAINSPVAGDIFDRSTPDVPVIDDVDCPISDENPDTRLTANCEEQSLSGLFEADRSSSPKTDNQVDLISWCSAKEQTPLRITEDHRDVDLENTISDEDVPDNKMEYGQNNETSPTINIDSDDQPSKNAKGLEQHSVKDNLSGDNCCSYDNYGDISEQLRDTGNNKTCPTIEIDSDDQHRKNEKGLQQDRLKENLNGGNCRSYDIDNNDGDISAKLKDTQKLASENIPRNKNEEVFPKKSIDVLCENSPTEIDFSFKILSVVSLNDSVEETRKTNDVDKTCVDNRYTDNVATGVNASDSDDALIAVKDNKVDKANAISTYSEGDSENACTPCEISTVDAANTRMSSASLVANVETLFSKDMESGGDVLEPCKQSDTVEASETTRISVNVSDVEENESHCPIACPATDRLYECGFADCLFITGTGVAFRDHNSSRHRDQRRFPCSVCVRSLSQQAFESCEDLVQHIDSKHQDIYSCVRCELTLHGEERLQAHMLQTHKTNTTFYCKAPECGFKSTVLAKFRVHLNDEHQGMCEHECFTCRARFDTAAALIRHLEGSVVRLLGCPHCNVICKMTEKHQMLLHVIKQHPSAAKTIVATVFVNCWKKLSMSSQNDLTSLSKSTIAVANKPSSPLGVLTRTGITGYTAGESMKRTARKSRKRPPSRLPDQSSVEGAATQLQNGLHGSQPWQEKFWNDLEGMEKEYTTNDADASLQIPRGPVLKQTARKSTVSEKKDDVNNDGEFACPSCTHVAPIMADLMQHLSLHPELPRLRYYRCHHCPYTATRMSFVERHLADAHTHQQFHLEVLEELLNVTAAPTVAEKLHCERCDFDAADSAAFAAHLLTCVRQYVCQLCPYRTSVSLQWRRHRQSHETQMSIKNGFRCGACVYTAVLRSSVVRHANRYHVNQPMRVLVIRDGRVCSEQDENQRTEPGCMQGSTAPTENGSDPKSGDLLQCNHCAYTTRIRSHYARHLVCHETRLTTGFSCTYCDYSSTCKAAITRHIRDVHAGADVAIKSFGQNVTSVISDPGSACNDALYDDDMGVVNTADEGFSQLNVAAGSLANTDVANVSRSETDAEVASREDAVLLRQDQIKLEPGTVPTVSDEPAVHGKTLFATSTPTPPSLEDISSSLGTLTPVNQSSFHDVQVKREYANNATVVDVTATSTRATALEVAEQAAGRRYYTCFYCKYVSMYSVSDIRKHVFHVHLRRTPPPRMGSAQDKQLSDTVGVVRSQAGVVTIGVLRDGGGGGGGGVADVQRAIECMNEYEKRIASQPSPLGGATDRSADSPSDITADEVYSDRSTAINTSLLLGMLQRNHRSPPPPPPPPNASAAPGLASTRLQFECDQCDFCAPDTAALREHHQRLHPEAQQLGDDSWGHPPYDANDDTGFSCGHCGENRFRSADDVAAHVLASHSVGSSATKRTNSSSDHDENTQRASKARKVSVPKRFAEEIFDTSSTDITTATTSTATTTKLRYCCSHCNFTSSKTMVMRHHVMAHLRYRPYRCPYCSTMRAVKGYPIKKHISIQHPSMPRRYLVETDVFMEQQVRDSFTRKMVTVSDENRDFRRILAATPNRSAPLQSDSARLDVADVSSVPPETTATGGLDKTFRCHQCGYDCVVEAVMRRHVMSHLRYRPYLCPHCADWAAVKSYPVRQHIIARHPGLSDTPVYVPDSAMEARVTAGYRCPPGHQKLAPVPSKPQPRGEKMRTPSANGLLYQCSQCNYATRLRTDMRAHISSELDYRPFVCAHCRYKSVSLYILRRHVRHTYACYVAGGHTVMEKDPQLESILEQRMSDSRSRKSPDKKPVVVTKPERPLSIRLHKCSQCSYTTRKRRLLANHSLRHRPPGYGCSSCGARFHHPSEYRRHAPACRGPTPTTLVCHRPELLKYATPQAHQHQQQRSAHSSVASEHSGTMAAKPEKNAHGLYLCPHCPYSSANVKLYRKHCKVHGPRSYQCSYCDKTYHVVYRLRRHCRWAHPGLPVDPHATTTGAPSNDQDEQHEEREETTLPEAQPEVRLKDVLRLSELELSRLLNMSSVSTIHC